LEAKTAAEAANRAKSAFLAMMSHELRTPMTGVIGMADFLSKSPLDEDQRRYVDTMHSSAQTLLTVLNDILDYSKIEADRLTLDCVSFDAVTLVTETVQLFWPKAEENLSSISIDSGDFDTLVVKGDPTRIKQVLGNLIGNAVKFTTNGTTTVRLRRQNPGNHLFLMFEVEDTGIGISEADMARLFLPFSQANTGTTRTFGGTGLGLAICKRLVNLMGGEITATSQPGRGSVFRFTCRVEPGRREDLAAGRPQPIVVPPLTILLAEDNPINRMIVKVGLEQRHHRVTVVENGAQACEAAISQPFNVILMDMQMPVMDGIEATRRIRVLPPPASEIPIVALTADALPEHRVAYMAAGLTDFLTKPIEWDEVDAVLARVHLGKTAQTLTVTNRDSLIANSECRPLINHDRLREIRMAMDPDDFRDLIREFIRCGTDELISLRGAINQGDLNLIHRWAHNIRGMYLNLGSDRAAAVAKELLVCEDIEHVHRLSKTLSAVADDTNIEVTRILGDGLGS
jgi:CheY-like chemotaxis protein